MFSFRRGCGRNHSRGAISYAEGHKVNGNFFCIFPECIKFKTLHGGGVYKGIASKEENVRKRRRRE
jgi:hypothetical protein